MRHELYSRLRPEQLKERISQLPSFPGRTEVREKVVCGEWTETGGRLWLLAPKIHYRGSAEPALLVLKLFETDRGTKVVWYFRRVRTIWPISGFLCAQLTLILVRDAFQEKLDWSLLPLALYVDMLEILVILWIALWLFELLAAKAFPKLRRSEAWLVQWLKTELLAEKPFGLAPVMEQEIDRLSNCTERRQ